MIAYNFTKINFNLFLIIYIHFIDNESNEKPSDQAKSELNIISVKLTDINFTQLNNNGGNCLNKKRKTEDIYTRRGGVRMVVRDERRRASHNEVERRRRDTINKWIFELSKVIPDCSNDHHSKQVRNNALKYSLRKNINLFYLLN